VRRIAFIYHRFYDGHGNQIVIGGIETYVQRMFVLVAGMGFQPILVQSAMVPFERNLGKAVIYGMPIQNHTLERQNQLLYEEAVRRVDNDDVIVFCTELCSVPTDRKRVISIQHGIYWDFPQDPPSRWAWLAPQFRSRRSQALMVKRARHLFDNCENRVCVDYNFFNWYRATHGAEVSGNVWIIPNYCCPAPENQLNRRNGETIRVLFARRFEIYRGTRVIADAIAKVLSQRTDISFTFAGEGPEFSYLAERFQGHPKVEFARYRSDQSVEFHLKHDIAVVPSLGSEGTSLSVAEAMGAGCAVVASAVGGITNMILDGYNGMLVNPVADEFVGAILRLADDKSLRQRIASNGYRAAIECFSASQWDERWKQVLDHVVAS
jgi:glycosyltransferase involved in cell wall biosynthesis